MTSRERIRCALEHKQPDRVPIHDAVWQSTLARWKEEGFPHGVSPDDYFGYEIARFRPDLGPQLPYEILEEDEKYITYRNSFGQVLKDHRDRSSTPQVMDSPIKTRNDWNGLKEKLVASEDRSIVLISYSSSTKYVNWRKAREIFQRQYKEGRFIIYSPIIGYDLVQRYLGAENLLIAISSEPDWVKEMYMTQAKLSIDMCELMIEKGFQFDGVFASSDLGYINGLLFSPNCYKEQLLPADKMLCDYFRSRNIPVILHSDGCVKELIPHFIEAGFSCLHPLEVKAGMDVRELKKKFGENLAFMGGIDTRLMSKRNPRFIEEEIKSKFDIAKKGGGYIYHSDHSIPPDVSFQQYQLVMELVKKYGKYD